MMGQSEVQGRVTLTRDAFKDGAVIELSSSVVDTARTPASVTIPVGSNSATFSISASTTSRVRTTVISATYAGVTRTAPLTVNPPGLEAGFYVMRGGLPVGGQACAIVNASGRLDCYLDATGSRGFPSRYYWTVRNGSGDVSFTTTTPGVNPIPIDCNLLSGGTLDSFRNYFEIAFELQVGDGDGNRSGNARQTVRVNPFASGSNPGYCGYFR